MEHTLHRTSQGPIVQMRGRFVHKDYAQVNKLLADLKGTGAHTVTLDLAGVEFIDSGAIGMLLLIREQLGGVVTLRGATGQPAQLLANARMGELFCLSN